MELPSFIRSIIGSKKSVDQGGITAGWTVIGGDTDGENDRNLLLANREWVYIAADKNARSVAGGRFKVMRYKSSSDDQEIFDGPLVDFLETPAKGMTGKDFIYLSTAYKELTGNAYEAGRHTDRGAALPEHDDALQDRLQRVHAEDRARYRRHDPRGRAQRLA